MTAPSLNTQIYFPSSLEDSSDSFTSDTSGTSSNPLSEPLSFLYTMSSAFPNSYSHFPNSYSATDLTPTFSYNQRSYLPQYSLPTPPKTDSSSSSSNSSDMSSASDSQYQLPPIPYNSHELNRSPLDSLNTGVYSSSGFDIVGILGRVINRPNPKIRLGPVDLSCAFLVVDARQYDQPIVYASDYFEKLTGYSNSEISGRNCRFLQSPSGLVTLGSRRRYTDNSAVHQIKNSMAEAKETQVSIVNYRKNGQPFINMITIIPISQGDIVDFYVGFQVDLVNQPNLFMDQSKDGSYSINYSNISFPKQLNSNFGNPIQKFLPDIPNQTTEDLVELITGKPGSEESFREFNKLLVENSEFVYVLTLKGVFLYVSPNSLDHFGYSNDTLMGESISNISHPKDMVPLMRELKESVNLPDTSFSLTHRIQCSSGDYIWVESVGKLHSDTIKGKRFMVLNGRVRPSYPLSRSLVMSGEPCQYDEFWCKISRQGLFLFVSKSCERVIGHTSEELLGTSIYSLVLPDHTNALNESLPPPQTNVNNILITIQGKSSQISLNSFFYPVSSTNHFTICRFLPTNHEAPASNYTSPSLNSEHPSCPDSSNSAVDLLDALNPNHATTWQYELHQLQLANNKLRQEIDTLTSMTSTKKIKRKRSQSKSLICHSCNRTESPEWRRGPDGPKTLCNSCGIKYAKKPSVSRTTPLGDQPLS